MRAQDFNELNVLDQKIMSIHEELAKLYGKRVSLLTGNNKPAKRSKKPSLKDLDLSTIDLSLD